MTTKILLTACNSYYSSGCAYNKGGTAVVTSTIDLLRKNIPDAEFITFIQLSDKFAADNNIKVIHNKLFVSKNYSLRTIIASTTNLFLAILWSITQKRLPRLAKLLVSNRLLKVYVDADIIIDLSMDHYSDDFGIVAVDEQSKDMLTGLFLKKPVIIWAQSIGPFREKLTKWLVKYTLKRVTMILLREKRSKEYFEELNIKHPAVYITADTAFTMEPATRERANEILAAEGIKITNRPLIGMTVGWTTLIKNAKKSFIINLLMSIFRLARLILPYQVFEMSKRIYMRSKIFNVTLFADIAEAVRIVDELIDKTNGTVLIISHVTEPLLDDRELAKAIIAKVHKPDRVFMLNGDYTAQELKAIIGLSDVFVGSKMHSNIAALSMNIPTIGIQYGHKFYGIMESLDQVKYVCDDFLSNEVVPKTIDALENSNKIKLTLSEKIIIIKSQANKNAELVADLISLNHTLQQPVTKRGK